MSVLALIPARMGSSRFPGKPLALLNGIPMIEHVYRRVSESQSVDSVIVATCDEEIAQHIDSIGGRYLMTSRDHDRASDRCAEALLKAEKQDGRRYEVVVMVQGDEPMTTPNMIDVSVQSILDFPDIQVVNLMAPIMTEEEFADPNCIKVVTDCTMSALYMSRSPIPSSRTAHKEGVFGFKQVCVIPFRRDFLIEYTNTEPTRLEIDESIDMLRVIENGGRVKMVIIREQTHAVDTEEDRQKVESLMLYQI